MAWYVITRVRKIPENIHLQSVHFFFYMSGTTHLMKMVLWLIIVGVFFCFVIFIKVLLTIYSVTGDVNEMMMFRNIKSG